MLVSKISKKKVSEKGSIFEPVIWERFETETGFNKKTVVEPVFPEIIQI